MSTDLRETPPPDRSPLDVAERVFQLVACDPAGLALDGSKLSHELPRREILLTELRDLLASRTLCNATRDAVWRELATRARHDGPMWLVGAVGTAVPALRRICGRLHLYSVAGGSEDIDIEVLTAFITAVKSIDLDPPELLSRMCAAAGRAGERARREAETGAELILADAVLAGDVTPTRSLAIASTIRRAAENTPKTSARSRITSDPQPIITKPKGGWGSPTDSARNPFPARHRLFRGLLISAAVAIVLAAAAADAPAESAVILRPAPLPKDLNAVFDNLRNWLIGLLAALATLMLTIGGLRYLVAGGDPGEVQKAKAALKAAAFGYGLAVLAPLFVSVLKRIVGGG
ncbi:hypothetical protein GCM10022419_132730 [Nonomuraea rosea]|uniref:Uncharacterized protein n=1 Tax=Nonomuraea rosea TaxID=638574 RepID=A0ABP7A490_9ACTN